MNKVFEDCSKVFFMSSSLIVSLYVLETYTKSSNKGNLFVSNKYVRMNNRYNFRVYKKYN